MTTGEKIKAARKAAGLTQKQLGERLGLSFQAIAQWENDLRNPKYETLQRIATALGVDNVLAFDLIGDNYQFYPSKEDRLPPELNDFEQFIESFGYYIRCFDNHYRVYNGKDSVDVTPNELKKLIRSSRKTVAALIEALIEEGRDDTAPAPETPPEAPDGPPEAK